MNCQYLFSQGKKKSKLLSATVVVIGALKVKIIKVLLCSQLGKLLFA